MAYLNNSVNDNLNNLTISNHGNARLCNQIYNENNESNENTHFNSVIFDMLIKSPENRPKKMIDASSLEQDIFCEKSESNDQNSLKNSDFTHNSPIMTELPDIQSVDGDNPMSLFSTNDTSETLNSNSDVTIDSELNQNENQTNTQNNTKKSKKKKVQPKKKEKKPLKWEIEYYENQKLRKEIIKKANSQIEEELKSEPELLTVKHQIIKFDDKPAIKEFTKITISRNYQKKQNKRKKSAKSMEEEKLEETPQEIIYKELKVKSAQKCSENLFNTYNFPLISLGLLD